MSFIDNLAGIASNVGLGRLAPSNTDAIKDSYDLMRRNSRDAKLYKTANRDGRTQSDTFFKEGADSSFEAQKRARDDERYRTANKHAGDMATKIQISKNHQQALGRADGDTLRDGTIAEGEKLSKFRDLNGEKVREHTKASKKARNELAGHAKDYYFSGDLGTNAMRWGATAGVYGAAAVGTRAITGGSATTNNQGQRDIAGIPFF